MHEVLWEFIHRSVIVYIDDILIYSRSLVEHRHHVVEVLQRLREYQLYLKAEKCTFHQPSVQFLGYNIDSSGIQMDERKLEAITTWTEPTTIKELQRFLEFANFYRRFIQNNSSIVSPLTDLLRGKPKSLSWSPAASEAFTTLKGAFTSTPLLVQPDPDLPFVLKVDASTTGPKNVKTDALSRIYCSSERLEEPECIIVSPIQWTSPPVASNAAPNNPPGCPDGSQYVPRSQCTPLIFSAHTSLGTGHPGANNTLSLLQERF